MKRKMSLLLSIIMALNIVLPFFPPVVTQAAPLQGFETHFNTTLTDGSVNTIPVLEENKAVKDGEALMRWSMSRNGAAAIGQGTFSLEYAIDARQTVKFTVAKSNNNTAEVTYELKNDTDDATDGLLVTDDKWSIWDNSTASWRPEATFIANFTAQDDYQVVDDLLEPAPSFLIRPGTGFSFRYEGNEVKFRWEGEYMYYQTNGFQKGRIFDIKLNYYDGASNVITADASSKIFTGINNTTFASIPVANVDSATKIGNTLSDFTGMEVDMTSSAAITSIVGTNPIKKLSDKYLRQTTPDEKLNNIPAKDGSDLILRFDLPMAYDYTKHDFVAKPTEVASGVITLAHPDNTKTATITVGDIFHIGTDAKLTLSPSLNAGSDTELSLIDGSRVHIRIPEIDSGILYSASTFTLASSEVKYSSPDGGTTLGYNNVYTFLSYEVVPENNSYSLVFAPYADYSGDYTLYMGEGVEGVTLSQSARKSSDGTGELRFPLALTSLSGSRTYQIVFSPRAETGSSLTNRTERVLSQIIIYEPGDTDSSIIAPKDFTVVSHNLVASPQPDKPAALTITPKWTVASDAMLQKLIKEEETEGKDKVIEVSYNLFAGLSPNADSGEQKLYARMAVKIKANDAYNTDPQVAEDTDNPKYLVEYEITYIDPLTGLSMGTESIGAPGEFLKYEGSQENKTYYIAPQLNMNAAKKGEGGFENIYFQYANIYFLCVQPVFDGRDGSYSNYDSVTIDDDSDSELPPVQDLKVTSVTTTSKDPEAGTDDEISADLSFALPGAKIKDFAESSFTMGVGDELTMNYNLYVSTNESMLVSEFGKLVAAAGETRIGVREEFIEPEGHGVIFPYKAAYDPENKGILYFSKIGDIDISQEIKETSNALSVLRDGEIAMIKDIPLPEAVVNELVRDGKSVPIEVILDGLDKNQKYYVYADLEVSFAHTGATAAESYTIAKDSILSNAVSFTTAADIVVPGEDEKKPPSPVLNKKNVSLDQATVYWPKLSALPIVGETIKYDIVRLRNVAMDSDMLEHDGLINTFLDEVPEGTEKKVYSVLLRDGKLQTLDLTTMKYSDTPAGDYKLLTEGDIEVTDISLLPNQIYYYYVRTVRTVVTEDGEKTQYSTWNYISVTTTPISEPINLEVDRSDRTAYDPYSEAILAFDAPIENLENLGNEYNVQYSIKKEGEDWSDPITMDVSRLVSSASLTDGYTHFKYKITGLEPSTAYSFMVRMIDKNKDASVWSNIDSTRTEYDQDGAEEERERNQWVQELQRQLRELLKQPYWYTADSSRTLSAIYRPTMFDALLWAEVDSQLSLVPSTQAAAEFNYYIPATALIAADAASKGFSFEHEGMQISIPAASFSMDGNDVLKSVAADIKEGRIEDYYVRVSVGLDSIANIDGKDALTDEITVGFEAYGSIEDNTAFDKRIFTLLDTMVESDEVLDKAEAEIDRLLSRDSESEEILAYIAEYVQEVRADMMQETEDEFDSIERRSQDIASINGTYTISVTAPNAQATVEGYRRETGGTWVAQTTMPFGAGHAIYTALAGSFAFAATTVDIAGLERLPYYNELAGVIGKYGLMDYIGEDVDVNGFATGQMVAGIVSRITGMQKGADPYAFLSSKGLNVSTRTQFTPVSNQESLYMLMYIYENKTNTKISTLTIRNFGVSAGVTALDDRYKKSVQIALQEGISAKTNMNAAEKMTVSDLLEALSRLNQKVRL